MLLLFCLSFGQFRTAPGGSEIDSPAAAAYLPPNTLFRGSDEIAKIKQISE